MKQIQIDRKFFAYLHLRPWIFLAFRIADPRTAPHDPYLLFWRIKNYMVLISHTIVRIVVQFCRLRAKKIEASCNFKNELTDFN